MKSPLLGRGLKYASIDENGDIIGKSPLLGRGLKLDDTALNCMTTSEVAPVGAWIEMCCIAFQNGVI